MREGPQGYLAGRTFDNSARSFDRLRRRLVPRFDDFYGSVLEILEDHLPDRPVHCLDLGTGTGLLAELVLDRFPQASITAIDKAATMVERAGARLDRFGGRVTMTVADYSTVALPAPVDAVISALSIHHLADEDKRSLFARIHACLRPGGLFVNADQSLGPTTIAEETYHSRWLTDVRALSLGEEELALALERIAQHRNAGMCDQLSWLSEAGFATVDIAWKRYRFTVFWARKQFS